MTENWHREGMSLRLVVVLLCFLSVFGHVCLLQKRPDPSNGDLLKWSLKSEERCSCTWVLAPIMLAVNLDDDQGGYSPCVTRSSRNTTSTDLWFTEDVDLLTKPINWNKKALDSLLVRSIFCDKYAPSIINVPGNITQTTDTFSSTAIVNWTEPSAFDDSGSQTLTSSHKPGRMFSIGSTRVVYTSIDAAGNRVTVDFFVTIVDIENPILLGMPDNVTKLSGHVNETIHWTEPYAADNSGNVSLTSSHTPGDVFPLGVTLVIYTAVDPAGNVETATFAIAIIECRSPLGMESRDITRSQVTASSRHSSQSCCYARYGRLHNTERWLADAADNNRWIKIDLLYNYTITGIIVQGWESWTKTLSVSYEMPSGSANLVNIKDDQGNRKIFEASTDGSTMVNIMFDEPIYTSIVQVEPKTCGTEPNCPLRLEILGCEHVV